MQIEIAYMVVFAAIAITLILTITRKMSLGIGIIGIATGCGIAWILSPYMQIVIEPIGQSIFYGAAWGIPAIIGIIHLISLVFMVIVAILNLMKSGGKITWA